MNFKKMEISKKKLQEILDAHKEWVDGDRPIGRANFSGLDLSGISLKNIDLNCVNFRNANLQNADLSGADLSNADFKGADLSGANLCSADLENADLSNAKLLNAKLNEANLNKACLIGADMRYTNLKGVLLSQADLDGACLPDTLYQIVGSGRQNRCTTYDIINDQIICGCWNDNNGNHLTAFENRIKDVYGPKGFNPDSFHYEEYMMAIKFFKMVRKHHIQETKE